MPGPGSVEERVAAAGECADDAQAVKLYEGVLAEPLAAGGEGEDALKAREQAVFKVAALYAKLGRVEALQQLLVSLRDFFAVVPKAKTAKIVRTVIDQVALVPDSMQAQIKLCKDCIAWAVEEKRTFLRQRIQSRLASLYLETKEYTPALEVINALVREVKRLDDKALLVEIQLVESRIHFALRNLPKSKAALTAARTSANAIYCPPLLQAQIDQQAGTLHAQEKDYKTAYSYFFEAFEAYSGLDHANALPCLKYMLLCRIMSGNAADVHAIITGKLAVRYAGPELESMKTVAKAYTERSLHDFEATLTTYAKELKGDSLINAHLTELYNMLLEQNLERLIEPFSRVEIGHVAELIKLPRDTVEAHLSKMILDKKLDGILDQGAGCLVIYDEASKDDTYPAVLETIDNMEKVVTTLFDRARTL